MREDNGEEFINIHRIINIIIGDLDSLTAVDDVCVSKIERRTNGICLRSRISLFLYIYSFFIPAVAVLLHFALSARCTERSLFDFILSSNRKRNNFSDGFHQKMRKYFQFYITQ